MRTPIVSISRALRACRMRARRQIRARLAPPQAFPAYELRELVRAVLRQYPEWSDRRIAASCQCHHATVGTVRREMVARGEIPHVTTRIDTLGRRQPATRPRRPEAPGAGTGEA